jgi:hypothetical protein
MYVLEKLSAKVASLDRAVRVSPSLNEQSIAKSLAGVELVFEAMAMFEKRIQASR